MTTPGTAPAAPAVAVADVPVGGGTILKDEKIVVTQPKKGDFNAFTAVCTHRGCWRAILCPCHGSTFSIEDGSRQVGPAQSGLASRGIALDGDQISVT